jgi:gas vesicle protein
MSDTGKIFGALILGAAAGAALGLLLAPEKGSKMRASIIDTASDLIDRLTSKINEGKEALSDLSGKAQSKAEEYKDKTMRKAEELKDQAHAEYNSMKGKAENMASKAH